VLREPEEPDVELRGFGDNGVNFAVEFWVDGMDDGKNKFTSEIRFAIWDALKKAGILMPKQKLPLPLNVNMSMRKPRTKS
jgi:potassium-dependent mechanosensitive channel